MIDLNIILFDGFETLDAFGPAELFGCLPEEYNLRCFTPQGQSAVSTQKIRACALPFSELDPAGLLLIPGGLGTRPLIKDRAFLETLGGLADQAAFVLTVCTGSALLAATGRLDGKKATGNKKAWDWAVSMGPGVNWVRRARWVADGKFYTSSGVSAGMDMALGFIADRHGPAKAREICAYAEYIWNEDKNNDPFA